MTTYVDPYGHIFKRHRRCETGGHWFQWLNGFGFMQIKPGSATCEGDVDRLCLVLLDEAPLRMGVRPPEVLHIPCMDCRTPIRFSWAGRASFLCKKCAEERPAFVRRPRHSKSVPVKKKGQQELF